MLKRIWSLLTLCILFMCITASYKNTVLGNTSKGRISLNPNASEIFWGGGRSKTSTVIRVSKVQNPFVRDAVNPATSVTSASPVISSSSVNEQIQQELIEKLKTANAVNAESPSSLTETPFSEPSLSIPTSIPGQDEKLHNSAPNAILPFAKAHQEHQKENLVPTPVASTPAVDASQGSHVKSKSSDVENDTVVSPQTKPQDVPSMSEEVVASNDSVTERRGSVDESETMPSFDEWKKKMLAEHQQTEGEKPVQIPSIPGKKPGTVASKRRRNYASSECGAKILGSNHEAEGPSRVLNEQMDMYMLNPCKAKIWIIIELCETIQATQFELANFELFSSLPRDFSLYSSDQFPTRDWTPLGTFVAPDQRTLHTFNLKQHGYGKFLKIELHGYYGHEHYCPLSLVRVFGTSMVDEYEEMETGGLHTHAHVSELDSESMDVPAFQEGEEDSNKNLFGSARDVVLNIVRKAARALGREDLDAKIDATTQTTLDTGSEFASINNQSVMTAVNKTTHSLWRNTAGLGLLLDQCGLCVESQEASPCFHSRKCLFFLSIFNISTIVQFCQTTACSLASYSNTTVFAPELRKVPKSVLDSLEVMTESINSEQSVAKDDTSDSVIYLPPVPTDIPTESEESINSTVVKSVSTTASIPTKESQEAPILQSSLSDFSTQPVEQGSTSSLAMSASFSSSFQSEALLSTASPELDEIQGDSFILEEDIAKDPIKKEPFFPVHDVTNTVPIRNLGVIIPTGQKESVFMRLSNRIKVLEMNMSLSSLYLQELSQRYRKQMEDMQKGFNRTVAALNDTAQLAERRDKQQQDAIRKLQLIVVDMKSSVDQLTSERESFYRQVLEAHLFLLAVETIVVITIMTLCIRRLKYQTGYREDLYVKLDVEGNVQTTSTSNCSSPLKRHNSTNDLMRSLVPGKKRRPSDAATYTGPYSELLIVEPAMPIFIEPTSKNKKRSRHRKTHRSLTRSVSNPNLNEDSSNRCQTCLAKKKEGGGAVSSVAGDLFGARRMSKNCENCCFFVPSLPTILSPSKTPKVPLQNVTNGTVTPEENGSHIAGSSKAKATSEATTKIKEQFSFRKLLKFRKNESV